MSRRARRGKKKGKGGTATVTPPVPLAPSKRTPYETLAAVAIYKWGAIQKEYELASLCRFVHQLQPSTVLEVGTALGGTFYCWIHTAKPDALLVSVDLPHGAYSAPHGDPESTPDRCYEAKKPEQRVEFLRCDSHDSATLEAVHRTLDGREVDFLFIDGDHLYEGVRSDFEMYSPLVRSGGLVAFHDIVTHDPRVECEVDRYWRELKREHKEVWEFVDSSFKRDICGIGVIRL